MVYYLGHGSRGQKGNLFGAGTMKVYQNFFLLRIFLNNEEKMGAGNQVPAKVDTCPLPLMSIVFENGQ